MNNKIKVTALILLLSSSLSVFSACSGNDSSRSKTSESSKTVSQSSQDSGSKPSDSSEESKTSTEASKEGSKKEDVSDPTDDKEKSSVPELSQPENMGEVVNGILIYNRTAFEQFFGFDDLAKSYAETMVKMKNYLGSDIKVYNVLVPTHCGIQLPQSVMDEYGLPDQNQYIKYITDYYTENNADIVSVNTYDTLMHHRDEYIYLNTDHHWSGLGAYYAYKDFCKAAGEDYVKLSELEKGEIEGYYGSLTAYVDDSYVDPDTVAYYKTDKDISTTLYENDGTGGTSTNLIHSYADSSFAYGVFLGGDNGLMVSKNPQGNGKKIAVVKESYGNAFCPYIAYTYGETHMIDFRYITFDFKQYLIDNDIHEVIFINNNMATATPARCEDLEGLIK